MTIKKHSRFSASASDRWLACPGSVALSEKAPPQRESEYAMEGTRAHSCLEELFKLSRGESSTKIQKKYGKEIYAHAFEAWRHVTGELKADSILLAETKVSLAHIHPEMFGTVDAAIVDEFCNLKVIDFKYGQGVVVDPKDNTQMIYYALALAHQYNYNFANVTLVIIQPRAEHEDGPIREWTLTVDELRQYEFLFKEGVDAALETEPKLNPGDHCRWCPAKALCPAISTQALAQAKIDFTPSGDLILPDARAIPVDKMAITLSAIPFIETWIEAFKEHAFNEMKSGVKIPGFKLVKKRSIRKWIDEEEIAKVMKATWGDRAFTKPKPLSPAQFEKECDPNSNFMGRYTSSESSGLTLVPNKDPRPPYNQLEEDFKHG